MIYLQCLQKQINTAAVVLGTFFAFTVFATVVTIIIMFSKYFKLQKLITNPMTRYTFQDKKQPIFDNPAMTKE